MRASLYVDFTATQTRCQELNLTVHDKASDVFLLALRGVYELQESGEVRMRIAALAASAAEQLVKIDA